MTIEITERDGRSWSAFLLQKMMKPLSPNFILNSSKLGTSFKDVKGSPELDTPPIGMNGCRALHRIVQDFHVYDIMAPQKVIDANKTSTASKKHIYYFAGGAFMAPAAAPFHWASCSKMAVSIPNANITIVSYPLMPHNSAPKSYAKIQRVMQSLIAESHAKAEKVIFAGDSSGSNLVLGAPLATLEENPEALMPDAIMAISPAVNFNHCNPRCEAIEKNDPMLNNAFCRSATKGWAGDWSYDDPRLSPIKADLSQWAKKGVQVHGVLGTYDVLSADAEEYMKKLQAAGVEGKWLVWHKQMHCFALASIFGVPESVAGFNWMAQTLSKI